MNWEKYRKYLPIAEGLGMVLFLWLTFYSVRETEFVLITQFGRPLYTMNDAGLHMKWFFQSANYFDRRLRIYNPRPSEFLTRDMALAALALGVGQAPTTAPCKARPVKTWQRPNPSKAKSSMTSKLSSSARPSRTAGRYPPGGGAVRRMRAWASSSPCRARMRPIVRTLGTGVIPSATNCSAMARAPRKPKALCF